ncbi:PilW family protein [Colwellia sp. E2M01]|uniref:PilW family protein n=1 Tax=Colwellia sp. E2M01 TaxID=2841561 RepID=UPI001C089E4A|nr:PilW family protein [Colwellia sp. E2M01]MBU2869393.1 PilW family protein [Colwellia sp. E2M01]
MNNQKIKFVNYKVKGFTIVELMISLSVGLILFAGVMTIFVGMRTTTAETSNYGELQENGRFAINILTEDLLRQNFWGDLSGTLSSSHLIITPAAPINDCVGGGVNNSTFPKAIGPFRTLWGETVVAGKLDPLGCFSSPAGTKTMIDSDILQLKRVIGNPVVAAQPDDFYFIANTDDAGIYTTDDATPIINNARIWQYQHHVYYVRERTVGKDTIPVLMQGRLANSSMDFSPIIDGIERIRFMYGIDTDTDSNSPGYGIVNAYVSAENMTQSLWENAWGTRILAVKIFVLARSTVADNKYTNTNTYRLGKDYSYTVNDNYRRLLFSTTVTLYNSTVEAF